METFQNIASFAPRPMEPTKKKNIFINYIIPENGDLKLTSTILFSQHITWHALHNFRWT